MGSLLESARAGDAGAFESLLAPLLDPAFRLAMVLLRDRPAAEDAVQEAAFKAWRALRSLRGGEPELRPWFLAIVVNECRATRRRRWWSVLLGSDISSGGTDPEAAAIGHTDLERALQRLTPEDRAPLYLHFYLDLPHAEVGRVLHISESAARTRVHRAVARLRPYFEEAQP